MEAAAGQGQKGGPKGRVAGGSAAAGQGGRSAEAMDAPRSVLPAGGRARVRCVTPGSRSGSANTDKFETVERKPGNLANGRDAPAPA